MSNPQKGAPIVNRLTPDAVTANVKKAASRVLGSERAVVSDPEIVPSKASPAIANISSAGNISKTPVTALPKSPTHI